MTLAVLPLAVSSLVLHVFVNGRALGAFDDVAARYRDQTAPLASLQISLWKAADAVEEYLDTHEVRHATAYREHRGRIEASFASLEHELVAEPRLADVVKRAQDDWKAADKDASVLLGQPATPTDPAEAQLVDGLDDQIERTADTVGAAGSGVAADLDADHATAAAAYHRSKLVAVIAAILSLLCIVAGVLIIVRVMRISVDRLVTGARKFSAGDREHRIDVTVPPELRDIAAELNKMIVQVRDAETALADQARRDVLTGLPNRRAFEEALTAAFARLRRMKEPVILVTLDIDHFKKINDTYGHAAGDAVLAMVGRTLASTVREVDAAFRVGGEEFAVLLTGADLAGAVIAAERLRTAIAANRVAVGESNITVTSSLGVALAAESSSKADTLLQAADHALYAAKSGGRNRVIVAGAELSPAPSP